MMTKQNITNLDDFINRLIPYESSQSKDSLYSTLKSYPTFKEQLELKLLECEDWTNQALESEKVYYCINNSAWKNHNIVHTLEVRLGFIDKHNSNERNLVVSFNIY